MDNPILQLSSLDASWQWQLEGVMRLLVASLLGALIGAERERHGRSAGFRTQLLVALGSALAMLVSLNFAEVYGRSSDIALRVDPGRVAYGVMGGIGFLGAGAIIRLGVDIRGLTTAASLWCTAAVGLACGFGMFYLAAVTTGVALFALLALGKIDVYIHTHQDKTLTVLLPYTGQDNLARFREILAERGIHVHDSEFSLDLKQKTETLTLHVTVPFRSKTRVFEGLEQRAPDMIEVSLR
jgi:putative Mg2+ transporter-C (MgtC) family protein